MTNLTKDEQEQIILLQKASVFNERARANIELAARRAILLELENEITRMCRDPLEALTRAMEANGLQTTTLQTKPSGR